MSGMLLLNRNTGTHQHVNPSLLSVRATMTLEEKLSPQVYKARPFFVQANKYATRFSLIPFRPFFRVRRLFYGRPRFTWNGLK